VNSAQHKTEAERLIKGVNDQLDLFTRNLGSVVKTADDVQSYLAVMQVTTALAQVHATMAQDTYHDA
jgi:hypothetical protein